jgi:HEAT repeat protein
MFGLSEEKIAKWGEKGKAAKLLKAAGTKKENLRMAVIKAMGNVKDEHVYNTLITFLRDRNPEIRMLAMDALKKHENKNALEHVRSLLHDTDSKVVEKAREVLRALSNLHD